MTAEAVTTSIYRLRDRFMSLRPSVIVFVALLVVYAALTAGLLLRTPLLTLDQAIVDQGLRHNHPQWYRFIHSYVAIAQRRPVTQAVLPILLIMAWRRRSPRPLLALAIAMIVLNASVGVVKLGLGRLGPRGGHAVDQFFAGGDIYPSGHTSNALVMYGIVAVLARGRLRALMVAVTAFVCLTVGAGTLYLNTHWISDVFGGWLAGGLVLCTVPWLVPVAERAIARNFSRWRAGISVAGAAAALYLNMDWVTEPLGPWMSYMFGGWLAAGLVLGLAPWLTPPVERRLLQGVHAVRSRMKRGGSAAAPQPSRPVVHVRPSAPAVAKSVGQPGELVGSSASASG